ncbi:MAG: hypothetical protein QNJ37_01110 [Crocosphaera sp.]|nr:hypothetical protein [Crocosphaera sp.]
MLLNLSFVPVIQIQSSIARSEFSEDDLEKYAQLILEAEGTVKPLVLNPKSFNSYEVVDGHFEYYAASKAREMDLLRGEMIGAFIIENEKQKSLSKQLEFLNELKRKSTIVSTEPTLTRNSDQKILNIESRLNNIEARFERQLKEVQDNYKSEIETLNKQLTEIKERLPKPIDFLEALNTFNLSTLTSHLSRIKVPKNIPEKIINEREKNGIFKSCSDVVSRVNGLAEKRMITIIDHFSNQ